MSSFVIFSSIAKNSLIHLCIKKVKTGLQVWWEFMRHLIFLVFPGKRCRHLPPVLRRLPAVLLLPDAVQLRKSSHVGFSQLLSRQQRQQQRGGQQRRRHRRLKVMLAVTPSRWGLRACSGVLLLLLRSRGRRRCGRDGDDVTARRRARASCRRRHRRSEWNWEWPRQEPLLLRSTSKSTTAAAATSSTTTSQLRQLETLQRFQLWNGRRQDLVAARSRFGPGATTASVFTGELCRERNLRRRPMSAAARWWKLCRRWKCWVGPRDGPNGEKVFPGRVLRPGSILPVSSVRNCSQMVVWSSRTRSLHPTGKTQPSWYIVPFYSSGSGSKPLAWRRICFVCYFLYISKL